MTALHAAGGGLPLALHIPHVVEQVGSVAGFASVIGLAILSALYFSQARDLRRLREWAGRAPERAAEGQPAAAVPGRVVAVPQQQQQQGPAQPAPANGEAAKPEQAAAATNGDAAPKVTAPGGEGEEDKAEGEAKEGEAPAPAAKPGMPAPASAAAAAAGAGAKSVTGPAAPGAPASGDSDSKPEPAPAGAAAPAAGGAAAGAAAAAASAAAAPPKPGAPQGPNAPAGGSPSGPRPAAQPQRPPGSVLPPRTGTLPPVRRLPSSNVSPAQTGVLGASQPPQKKKRNPVYIVLAIAGVLVLGAAAAIGVPALVNGSKDNNAGGSTTASSKTGNTATKKKAAPVSPDKITVAVLNGTTIPGLAAQVGDRVDAEGFTLGTVSNASQADGQRANSVAMYASGHKADAEQVARKLNIRNVSRIDANSQGIAGDASVVVIVGSDKTQ